MFTVTLMAQPGGLEASTVEAVYGAWGGSQLNWLSGGEAAAFALPVLPDNQWQVWADLQKLQIDLVVQASAGRQKKLLLADMDSTMIQQECIDELADVAGVGDRVKGITARAMNGELDFNSALIERVGLLKDLDVGVIDRVLADRITLMPGGAALVSTMRANGAYAALVSGGFTAFTSAVAGQLGFDENRANTLIVKDGKLTGDVA
ncbi:MAG: phosphoserine phosphatase SerB, partial [Marinovum sp.]|nr:phosphoserine phosphatase SerB [Marinovum sp.]